MDDYRGGHIMRIKLINFMTYNELELFPKHGLNLILGLNGSGKSSIMCAICLGLAGKPQYTGRGHSSQLSDFIKFGCNKATIEIELDDPNSRKGIIVIKRIIQKEKSTWLLNKSLVSQEVVQNAVEKFNIDVSNLCQFLPQEKVAEFSKMDKKQRLENLLQAIGEPKLHELFKELKQMKADSLKIEEEIKKQLYNKDTEDQLNARIRIDAQNEEEKKRMKEKLMSLKQQKYSLEYEELRIENEQLGDKRTLLKHEKNVLSNIIFKINDEVNKKCKEFEEVLKKVQDLSSKLKNCQNAIMSNSQELEDISEQADKAKINYQNQIEEKRNKKSMLAVLKKEKEALEELCKKNLELKPIIEKKINDYEIELKKINTDKNIFGQDRTGVILKRNRLDFSVKETLSDIEKMKNEESKKLMLLQQRFKDVYEGFLWLNQNKDKFKAPVHPPILLLLKVAKEENRKYIMNAVFERDLIAFLCEDKEDSKLLTRILREDKNLQVNIVVVPDKPIEFYQSPPLSTELKQLGIQCFLKDMVDAPDAVMRFLCHCCHIHMIPLCASSSEKYMSDILEKFKVFFTPDEKFKMKASKYSQNRSIRRDPVMSDNLLPSFKDHSNQLLLLQDIYQQEQKKLNVLNDDLQKIENVLCELEKKESDLKEEKRNLHEELQKIESTERQLLLKSQLYDGKKNEVIDEETDKIKMINTIQQKSRIVINNCAEIMKDIQHFYSLKLESLKCNLHARAIHKFMTNQKKLIEEKNVEYETVCKELNEISEKRKEIQSKGKTLLDEGKVNRNLTPEEKLMFHTLCSMSNKEDIEREILRIEATLELDSESNAEVITEYHKRKERIESIQREIENHENKLKEIKGKMNEKKKEWFPYLSRHIQNINSKFSRYFKQLNGCSGEIIFDDANNSDDFLNYGLQILLKYRDEDNLEELSNTRHSGGECSVATIIFILSLQELTDVPFRCIDEINQGMDSQNERNIYNLIADCAKGSSYSQYFLLTPKLLPDLKMIENTNVAVHILFNSQYLEMKLDVRNHIQLDD